MRYRCILLLVSVIFLSGPFELRANLKGIKSIGVDSSVESPEYFGYVGTTSAVLFGLSSLVAANNDTGKEFEQAFRSRSFNMASTFRSDFISALKSSKIFSYGGSSRPSAMLDVREYGIMVAPTGFKRLKPELEAEVIVRDAKGSVIYKSIDGIGINADSVEGSTYEQYKANPNKLIADLKVLSRMLAKQMVNRMERNASSSSSSSSSSTAVSVNKRDRYRTK